MSYGVTFERSRPSQRLNAMDFSPYYHRNSVNHCPGCGQAQWYVGRVSAECAFCATALPFEESGRSESRIFRQLTPRGGA